MVEQKVILVSMPWAELNFPSIQLGILKSVLDRAGIQTEVRSFYLSFADYLINQTVHLPQPQRLQITDYQMTASRYWYVGLGDWIFTVPPFQATNPQRDEAYFNYLRSKQVEEGCISKAIVMRQIVPDFLRLCVEDLLVASPAVIGFTSCFSQNVPSLVLAQLLKQQKPSIRILFGGANCDGEMGAALIRSFSWIDVVIRGEGERTLPIVLKDLFAGHPIQAQPGLCYRENGQLSVIEQSPTELLPMDDIPIPNYDEYFTRLRQTRIYEIISPKVKLLFESARGCWWGEKMHCTFCGLNGSSMAFRSKSAERLIDEIFTLSRRYQRLNFEAVDNILDWKYLQTVLPQLQAARKAGFDFTFFYETKANLKKEHLHLMSAAGIRQIQPGIESLSHAILMLMRKGVNGIQNIRLLKWASQYGIQVTWNIIYGFPGEPPEEYDRMAQVIPSLTHLKPPSLIQLHVQRFSSYQEHPDQFGLEITGPASYYRFLYDVDDKTLHDLAYDFAYRYIDGRNPAQYIQATQTAIELWDRTYYGGGMNGLIYYRGPGFLKIDDRRPNLSPRGYAFGETEAQIYLSCDAGATPMAIWQSLRLGEDTDLTVEQVKGFLDELVQVRLVYEEDDHYLSLALPANPEAEGIGVEWNRNLSTAQSFSCSK